MTPRPAWKYATYSFVLLALCVACGDDAATVATVKDASTPDAAVPMPGADAGPDAAGSKEPAPSSDPLRVKLDDGELEGKAINDEVRAFLGIPYAKPPVGALRWKAPQKNDGWSDVREAKEFSARCAQPASQVPAAARTDNEDCLYLNVWAPSPAPKTKLPVMVWIHGGGNLTGSTADTLPFVNSGVFYDGQYLVKRGIVMVSLNYRLGVFGFFAHAALEPEGSVGNQGLRDQQLALQWVKTNIAKFGGDPSNVTIFGESAGSFDVCFQVASPKSRGLFQRAISESGGCTTLQPTKQQAEAQGAGIAMKLGCAGSDALACLRGKTASELLDAAPNDLLAGGTLGAIVDGDFLPDQGRALFDRGDIAKVPYILGSNTDEGTLFVIGTTVKDQAGYMTALEQRFGADAAAAVAQQYPASKFGGDYSAALARAFGDGRLVCTTFDSALRAAAGGATTYMYNYDVAANVPGLMLGATHGSELTSVFATAPDFSDKTRAVSDRIGGYWTNFAKSGDPNGGGLLDWPKFTGSSNVRMNLALESSVVRDFRSEDCAFWRAAYDKEFAAAK
jgi:para-nitrobenzyl esterase